MAPYAVLMNVLGTTREPASRSWVFGCISLSKWVRMGPGSNTKGTGRVSIPSPKGPSTQQSYTYPTLVLYLLLP